LLVRRECCELHPGILVKFTKIFEGFNVVRGKFPAGTLGEGGISK
jgi:hypothetical protein